MTPPTYLSLFTGNAVVPYHAFPIFEGIYKIMFKEEAP